MDKSARQVEAVAYQDNQRDKERATSIQILNPPSNLYTHINSQKFNDKFTHILYEKQLKDG